MGGVAREWHISHFGGAWPCMSVHGQTGHYVSTGKWTEDTLWMMVRQVKRPRTRFVHDLHRVSVLSEVWEQREQNYMARSATRWGRLVEHPTITTDVVIAVIT
jgi:hypothetical protein